MPLPPKLGVVVGLVAEARLARTIARPELIAASAATPEGARRAAALLVARGATHLLSFGFAAGLDPSLRPGTVLLPRQVMLEGEAFATDETLAHAFGQGVEAPLLHSERLVTEREEKRALFDDSGCASLDMESGAVARVAYDRALPFAVLRTVCDPAQTTLPNAARVPLLNNGAVNRLGIARSILRRPGQIPALITLARDVQAAQRALRSCLDPFIENAMVAC